jgi:hypothetical protein
VRSLWGCLHAGWCYLPSSGAFGGILLLWDKMVVEKIEVCVGQYVVACSFRNVADDFTWACVVVYGPNIDSRRRSLWEELVVLFCWRDLPWCIGGDFNVSCFPCKRSGEARFRPVMTEFLDFISELGLMDLPLSGGSSTWSINSSWFRVDHFLVSSDWEVNYPRFLQKRVPRLCSDHFPILLDCVVFKRVKNLLN